MRTLINWIIRKLRRKSRFEAALQGGASVIFSGDRVRIRRGCRWVDLSRAEYVMLLSLRAFQPRNDRIEVEVAL